MDWVVACFLMVAAAIHGAHGDAMVSGSVFCDQCKDGQISLFDYPLIGIKVSMACPGQDGQLTVVREETTNWLGRYMMRFDGAPNMDSCRAQVSGNGQGCEAVSGPAQNLRLVFQMFDTEMYTVDHLISQPAQPMSFCPRSPRLPFLEASACPYGMWMMPEHKCYWRVLSPDLKVALVFGPLAARKYGTNISLRQSLNGRADPYATLLREATTALLNSYNSIQFPYQPLEVIQHLNWSLMGGSTRQVLMTALRFLRANSGQTGNVSCRFTNCK